MIKPLVIVLVAVATLTLFQPVNLAQKKAMPVEARVKQLHQLLDGQWEYTLRTNPEYASILGDKRYNDKLSDNSQAAIESDLSQTKVFLQKFEAIDTTGFPEQEQSIGT